LTDDDEDIIRFRNAKNELIEAVEVRTEDNVPSKYQAWDRIENYDEDDEIDDVIEPIIPTKDWILMRTWMMMTMMMTILISQKLMMMTMTMMMTQMIPTFRMTKMTTTKTNQ
jgi:hypothetical protein